jgi:hypothetical protein
MMIPRNREIGAAKNERSAGIVELTEAAVAIVKRKSPVKSIIKEAFGAVSVIDRSGVELRLCLLE